MPEDAPGPAPIRIALIYALAFALFLVALPALVLRLGAALDGLLRLPAIPGQPARTAAGLALAVCGLGWVAWTNWALVRLGRGHPQEAFRRQLLPATQRLVVTGPFRHSRNPMVFGALTVLEGLSLAVGSLAGAVLVVPATALVMAAYLRCWEEPGLVERFGADYERYRERVPMIVPRPWRQGA